MWVVSLYKAIKQLITTPKLLIPNIHLYLLKMPFTIFDISGVGSVVVDLEAVYFFAKLCMTFFSPPTTKFFLHKLKLDTFFLSCVVCSILFSFWSVWMVYKIAWEPDPMNSPKTILALWFWCWLGFLPIISLTDWWNLLSLSQDINTIADV